jgi:hypothetical protein
MLPMAHARGFSGDARRNRPRERLTGLPGPQHVRGRVFVAVQYQPTAGTDMRTHRQALHDPLPTAAPIGQHPTAVLRGIRRGHRFHSLPGACCLESEDREEVMPPSVANTLVETGLVAGSSVDIGAVLVLLWGGTAAQVGRLNRLDVDRVVGAHKVERGRVVEKLRCRQTC